MKIIYTLIAALLITNMIMAAPVITAKVNNGDWSAEATWDLNRVPADNDTIIIPANMTIRMTRPRSLDNVVVKVYGTFFFESGKLNLNNSSRFILEIGGSISGTDQREHLSIGNVIKFLGNETAITGTSFADNTTGISPWGFRVSSSSLLPVTFMNFYAGRSGQHISLSWATAQETNNDHFEIERSYDGRQWNMIAIVFGAGNSNVVNKYSYTDKNISRTLIYYRIRQVDYNGRSEYSAVKMVRNTEAAALTEIYVSSAQTVAVNLPGDKKDNVLVKVFNMNGQVVAQQHYPEAAYQVTLRLQGTVTGVHVVQVSDGIGWREVKKVVL